MAAKDATKGRAAPRFERAIPILRIFDVAKAKDYYLGHLGFAPTGSTGSARVFLSICRSPARA